jgi:hypothetical protein
MSAPEEDPEDQIIEDTGGEALASCSYETTN